MIETKTTGIACPKCGSTVNGVKDCRPALENRIIRRRRACECGNRFTTREMVIGDSQGLMLVTASGRIIPVDLNMEAMADQLGGEIGKIAAEGLKVSLREAMR